MAKTTDLTEAVKQLRQVKEDGITTPELAKMFKCGKESAARIRNDLIAAGKLKPTILQRADTWGSIIKVKGFVVVK